MILLRILLFPFACIYGLVTNIRNRMYDLGLKPSVKFDTPVISVGNLTVGGTGKTPMIEHLIRLLNARFKVATLSRGYGRKTRGIRIGNDEDDAETLGDEPLQLYLKFGSQITVAVGEERALAIPTILQTRPETQIILMDDAFQHRQVKPLFSILLTDYHRPFYNDFILPAGRLREGRSGANRADVIVVTKCPQDVSSDQMMQIQKSITAYGEKPVFFTRIRYGQPVAFPRLTKPLSRNVALVTAIANSKPLHAYISGNFNMVKHFEYEDHHSYTEKDIYSWLSYARNHQDLSFITTEKDKVKIDKPCYQKLLTGMSFFYLPIAIDFEKNGEDFDEMVLNVLEGAL
jgi:tetraacyldisaccharide 4'-kinase